MPLAIGELYQVTLVMLLQGQTVENVLMFRERTGSSTDDQIKEDVRTFWHIYRDMISSTLQLQELRAKRMTPAPLDTLVFGPTTGDETGGYSSVPMNCTIAAITTLRTGLAGKRHRGRVYTPGWPADRTSDNANRVDGTGQALRDTKWDAIMAEFDDATGTALYLALGIYSRLIGGTNPFTVGGWQAVTQYVNRPIFGNQRRRREGVGA
jgi:hypothetical protein